ncbi:MAG: GtrA family protein [Pseudomonadota bacterium]
MTGVVTGALRGQIARFGAAGLANVGVDLSVYAGLLYLGAAIPLAKAAAFICGTTFAYFANKNWTFKAGKGSAGQFGAFAALYAVSMMLNVGVNSAIIAALGATLFGKTAAYCGALALSATLNFIGMREILLARRSAATHTG